jgi:hypothetical protein
VEHNKSGSTTLSILNYEDEVIMSWVVEIKAQVYQIDFGLIEGSPCTLIKAQDGRFTKDRVKVGYAYQILAFEKFGRDKLMEVPPSKASKNDLVISHLCGTRNCCNSNHFILESKEINDERVHCHWCLRNIFLQSGWDGVRAFFNIGGCTHNPRCCTEYII